jgi:hypothetical protein
VDKLEILARVDFLKVHNIVPAFANVYEYTEISDFNYDSRFQKKRIAIVGEKIFLLQGEIVNPANFFFPSRNESSRIKVGSLILVRRILGVTRFEKLGKRIWVSRISQMKDSSRIKGFYIEMATLRKRIERHDLGK